MAAFAALPRRTLVWSALFIALLAGAAWAGLPAALAQETASPGAQEPAVSGFELLDSRTGWVRRGADLDWTDDGGASWRRITPAVGNAASSAAGGARLEAVYFRDTRTGWALLSGAEAGPRGVALAATADAGESWRMQPLPAALAQALQGAKAVHLVALSAAEGFIAADLAQSSNFSRGALWYTADGGVSWAERSLPLGEAPQFIDALTGWVAGGPRGDELWRTEDGGVTWVQQDAPLALGEGERMQVYTPLFTADGQAGVLPLLLRGEAGQTAAMVWLPGRGGSSRKTPLFPEDPSLPGSLDARAALLAASGEPLLPPTQPLPFFANTEIGGGLRLAEVKMAEAQRGWALATDARRNPVLLATADGGATWQPLDLPPAGAAAADAGAALAPAAAQPLDTGSRTAIVQGAGFDICDLPTLSELAAWRNAGPYRTINLYLGGVLRFCDNERLTAANVAQLSAQGWTFIPTWVGPQAPCSVYKTRFSSDPAAAYAQGAAEAGAALDALRSLGLSEADGSGAVVYYDLESFDAADEEAGDNCIAAGQAFVSGWTDRLHAAGSQAGLYGSACSPGMDLFAAISAPPDAVWVAQWNRGSYDPAMTVWGVACLDNTLWARSQRIRQYTGGHDETWGGVTLNIDSNVLDGPAADLSRALTPTPTATPTSTPTPAPTPTPQPVVVVEAPELQPPYAGDACASGWQPIDGGRGHPAYVAANRADNGTIPPAPAPSTPPAAQWQGAIPSSGSYRVEAYIPGHGAIDWACPPAQLAGDTATARYSVEHAAGTEVVVANQAAASGAWLPLGVFPFTGGRQAVVRLETVTDEDAATRAVTAGALRLTRQADTRGGGFLYLPQIRR